MDNLSSDPVMLAIAAAEAGARQIEQAPDAIDWVPAPQPPFPWTRIPPTPALVRSTTLGWCPGARLTADMLGVEDSLGYRTLFYWCPPGQVFARVIDPAGRMSWQVAVWRLTPEAKGLSE